MIPIFPGGLGVVELGYDVVIVGNSGKTELASAVTAGAFVHRIFAWLVPILVGLIPRRMGQEHGEGQGGREHVPGRYAV